MSFFRIPAPVLSRSEIMSGLYVHIPFCASRCAYCGFFSTTAGGLKESYVNAVCTEAELLRDHTDAASVQTLYLGGGTPSQLGNHLISKLIEGIGRHISLSGVTEATIECNPDDISRDFLDGLRTMPFNRISLGVQSLDDSMLRFLNRRHSADEAKAAIRLCIGYGFTNVSADLIYGLPGQTPESFRNDIVSLCRLGITHLSAYALSYEEGTPLSRMLAEGRITATDDDSYAEMYDVLCRTAVSEGFQHYEISNFCRPGFHSRHNSCYWDGTHYIGLGAGAHSFDGQHRSWNVPDLKMYIGGMADGERRCGSETLSGTDLRNEMIMLSLRTSKGLPISEFSTRFGECETERLLQDAGKWIRKGKLILCDGALRLSESAMFLGDGIVSSLFAD